MYSINILLNGKLIIMNNIELKELVRARYEYFVSVGFAPIIAIKMAKENFPDGIYFATPFDK